jgi:hypothetical protein
MCALWVDGEPPGPSRREGCSLVPTLKRNGQTYLGRNLGKPHFQGSHDALVWSLSLVSASLPSLPEAKECGGATSSPDPSRVVAAQSHLNSRTGSGFASARSTGIEGGGELG